MQYGGNHLPPYYAVIAWGVTINFHKNYLVTNQITKEESLFLLKYGFRKKSLRKNATLNS